MAEMGVPASAQKANFANVQMHNKPSAFADSSTYTNRGASSSAAAIANANASANITNQNKGDLLNSLSGYKNDKGLIVDGSKHNKMGKDEFLKLLTYQLSNQDPTNPMDQKKFAADLAQFSQLEQLANINTTLSKQGANAAQETKFYGASFLGKEIKTGGTTVDYSGQGKIDLPFFLDKKAANVMVRLFDSKNQMISELHLEDIPNGQNSIEWDGIALDGAPATKGTYHLDVTAWDRDYNQFKGKTQSTGVVTGVNFEDGETILVVDGKKRVFLRDVESFSLPRDNNIKKNEVSVNANEMQAMNDLNIANDQMNAGKMNRTISPKTAASIYDQITN